MKHKMLKHQRKLIKFITLNTLTKEIIKNTSGCLFEVTFTKADGTERTMLAKVGVRKYLSKKVGKRVVKDNPNLVRVFDAESKSYKSFKLDTVKQFKFKNVSYSV